MRARFFLDGSFGVFLSAVGVRRSKALCTCDGAMREMWTFRSTALVRTMREMYGPFEVLERWGTVYFLRWFASPEDVDLQYTLVGCVRLVTSVATALCVRF